METINENKKTRRPQQSGSKIPSSNLMSETYSEQIALQDESGWSSRDRNDPEESQSDDEDLDSTPLEETDPSEEDEDGEGYYNDSLDHEGNKDYSNTNSEFLK